VKRWLLRRLSEMEREGRKEKLNEWRERRREHREGRGDCELSRRLEMRRSPGLRKRSSKQRGTQNVKQEIRTNNKMRKPVKRKNKSSTQGIGC
jgi:hypothetical protein